MIEPISPLGLPQHQAKDIRDTISAHRDSPAPGSAAGRGVVRRSARHAWTALG